MAERDSIALALTGASGADYGLRLLEQLLAADKRVLLMLSKPGQVVLGMETDLGLPGRPAEVRRFFCERHGVSEDRLAVYGAEEWTAPIASGSNAAGAMVICPCSMGTVASVAAGLSRSLIERAADVMLKERRPLILVPRETPYSTLHLENMLKLSRMGALILPPNPGFYQQPQSISDLVDFVVARILDQLDIDHSLGERWGELE